ncbi:5857_t:CDS:2 [Acaulospora colombiana]|uniref:5857_t:CDS:1 n=1 Tax=Acaulospora colombiana TaxID=27376 RepID=A0ACA9PYJ4_9GLOM|nr:5857_t:CDS:2 [Acaulospora colombiana]
MSASVFSWWATKKSWVQSTPKYENRLKEFSVTASNEKCSNDVGGFVVIALVEG